jgi:hypothetical protein
MVFPRAGVIENPAEYKTLRAKEKRYRARRFTSPAADLNH